MPVTKPVHHQFRPVSTDLSNKLSAIGLGGGGSSNVAASKENDEVDGDSGGNGKASTGGVMLINCKFISHNAVSGRKQTFLR